MAFGAAPGTRVDVQFGRRADDADLSAGFRLPQGAFDQEIPAFREPEAFRGLRASREGILNERVNRTETFDGRRKLRVALDAAGNPALQPFEIEQRANAAVAVGHAQGSSRKCVPLVPGARRRTP